LNSWSAHSPSEIKYSNSIGIGCSIQLIQPELNIHTRYIIGQLNKSFILQAIMWHIICAVHNEEKMFQLKVEL